MNRIETQILQSVECGEQHRLQERVRYFLQGCLHFEVASFYVLSLVGLASPNYEHPTLHPSLSRILYNGLVFLQFSQGLETLSEFLHHFVLHKQQILLL